MPLVCECANSLLVLRMLEEEVGTIAAAFMILARFALMPGKSQADASLASMRWLVKQGGDLDRYGMQGCRLLVGPRQDSSCQERWSYRAKAGLILSKALVL